MLMASHTLIALQSSRRPTEPGEQAHFLAGAVAPDVRYVQEGFSRQASHDPVLGRALAGSFGLGYRHHLAVDLSFYRRCESSPIFARLGAMNTAILAEIHALRRLPAVAKVQYPVDLQPLYSAGCSPEAMAQYLDLCQAYLYSRNIDTALKMLTASLRDRAARYLQRWEAYGTTLTRITQLTQPIWHCVFDRVRREADLLLEEHPS